LGAICAARRPRRDPETPRDGGGNGRLLVHFRGGWGRAGEEVGLGLLGGEAGVGEELGTGEAGDGGVFGVGEVDEAQDGGLGVVLGEDLELLGEEGGAELAVGLEFGGGEEGLGFFVGEFEVFEEIVEVGGALSEGVGDVVEGFAVAGLGWGFGRGGGCGRIDFSFCGCGRSGGWRHDIPPVSETTMNGHEKH
jgi:hypothetical protein